MINRNDEIQQKNIDLLIEGYWYEDLPPVIDMEKIKKSVKNIIENIDNDVYEDFRKTNDIITEYKNTEAPTYIFNDGIEPITFFEFKKNGALREMQIPNLKYYCTFVYNTISVYDELFNNIIFVGILPTYHFHPVSKILLFYHNKKTLPYFYHRRVFLNTTFPVLATIISCS